MILIAAKQMLEPGSVACSFAHDSMGVPKSI